MKHVSKYTAKMNVHICREVCDTAELELVAKS